MIVARFAGHSRSLWARVFAVLACALALGCTRSASGGNGGNTSWLSPCDEAADCTGPSLCVSGTCLATCSTDATCEALSSRPWLLLPTATCDEARVLSSSDDPDCAAAPRRVCAPACERDADCDDVGTEYQCDSGVCRSATCTPSDIDVNQGGTGSGPMSTGGTDAGGPAPTCTFEGQSYQPGETYLDDCNLCSCQSDGGVVCDESECVAVCEIDGVEYLDGETFPAEDGCNECECTTEGASCTSGPCPAACVLDGDAYEVGESVPDEDCNPKVCTAGGWEESTDECPECHTDEDCDESAPYCFVLSCGEVGRCAGVDNLAFEGCEQNYCLPDCDGNLICRELFCNPQLGPVCGCDGLSYEIDCDADVAGIAHEGLCEAPKPEGWDELGCACDEEIPLGGIGGLTVAMSLECYALATGEGIDQIDEELEAWNQPRDCDYEGKFRREGCGRTRIWFNRDGEEDGRVFDSESGELVATWFLDWEPVFFCGAEGYYGGEPFDCPTATTCELCREGSGWGGYDLCPEAECDPDAGGCP